MAVFNIPNVQIAGLCAAVPKQAADNLECDLLSATERKMFVDTVGIRYRRIAPAGVTAADLCLAATEKLLNELKWGRDEIGVLVFVTQTPDYIIPNTSSLLQHKLGLSKSTLVFDVNLGCSGYVYGLSIISSLMQNIPNGKGLLLVGDVSTHTISSKDQSTVPLFSDAGSATALHFSTGNNIPFNLQTDGAEYDSIIVEDGGFRNRTNELSFIQRERGKGILRSNLDMKLDGLKIFNFALREVAPNINLLMETYNLKREDIDAYVFHQANLLMLDSVRKKIKIDKEKVPYSLFNFGNTSSASIPVTIATQLRQKVSSQPMNLLLSGFGVGLSWGSCVVKTNNICCPELVEI